MKRPGEATRCIWSVHYIRRCAGSSGRAARAHFAQRHAEARFGRLRTSVDNY